MTGVQRTKDCGLQAMPRTPRFLECAKSLFGVLSDVISLGRLSAPGKGALCLVNMSWSRVVGAEIIAAHVFGDGQNRRARCVAKDRINAKRDVFEQKPLSAVRRSISLPRLNSAGHSSARLLQVVRAKLFDVVVHGIDVPRLRSHQRAISTRMNHSSDAYQTLRRLRTDSWEASAGT
jgi:hypothetical protein